MVIDSKASTKKTSRQKAAEASRRREAEASRLAVIEALPNQMQDHALVDWPTVAVVCGFKDIEHARETIRKGGVPLTHVSARKELPTWGALRTWLQSRETNAAA